MEPMPYLMAVDGHDRILSREADIVETNRRRHIKDIYPSLIVL